jgi:predicted site-specific integrase-resolvase
LTTGSAAVYHQAMKQFLNAAKIARLLGVDKSTVVKWIKKGYFTNILRPGGKGHYHIPLASYEEFVSRSKRP